jgi:hypothetical protein
MSARVGCLYGSQLNLFFLQLPPCCSNKCTIVRRISIGILEGTLRYREVEDEVMGTTMKHRHAEIHANNIKRLSKIEAAGYELRAFGSSLGVRLSAR